MNSSRQVIYIRYCLKGDIWVGEEIMKQINVKRIASVLLIGGAALLYQNCSNGFSTDIMVESSSLALGSKGGPGHEDLHITSNDSQMQVNSDVEFFVQSTQHSLQGLTYTWTHTLNGVLGRCLVKSQNNSSNYVLNCPEAGKLAIAARVTEDATSTVLPSYSVTLMEAPSQETGLTVNFVIPDGTGSKPWNTESTMVETFVGQTLKITNNDSVTHQLHTNGKPCAHGAQIATGASVNCTIGSAYDYKTNGIIYDHNLGTKSTFYLIAYDGAALYTQNCASCHGALASSTKKGIKTADIKRGLVDVSVMKSNANLMKLTQRQLEAIAYALSR